MEARTSCLINSRYFMNEGITMEEGMMEQIKQAWLEVQRTRRAYVNSMIDLGSDQRGARTAHLAARDALEALGVTTEWH